jgi:hypothetical protein
MFMKCLPILVSIIFLSVFKVSAQKTANIDSLLKSQYKMNPEDPGLPISEVARHLGSSVYIRDTISDIKIISDSLTLLYIGGKYPNHVLTIIIKGKKLNKQTSSWWKNGIGHFSGLAILYEGKPAITIYSQWQLGTVIQI